MGQRKHDDAHRPMGGRGQRGNRAGKPANWGGAELVEHQAQRYLRKPDRDKRIARGDDFAGDAWLDTKTGQTVYTVVGFDRNAGVNPSRADQAKGGA